MPVKGIMPGLLEIGKIKIGIKGEWVESQTGVKFRPPKKLDHFVITTNERNENGDYLVDTELVEKLKADDKAKVNADGNLVGIPIRLLYNDTDLCFPTRYVCYKGAKIAWYSNDGITMHTRDGREVPFNPQLVDPDYQGEDKGKINGVLSVIIEGAETFGGCWKFRTTSINTVKSILGSLSVIKHATGGRLAFLPLMLTVQPKSTVIPGTGAPTTVHIVSVVFQGSVEALQQKAITMARENAQYLIEMQKVEDEARKIVDEAEVLTPEEEKEVAEEFFPESVEQKGAEPSSEKGEADQIHGEAELSTESSAEPLAEQSTEQSTEPPTEHAENIPPSAPKWDMKNSDDPTDPVNWLRRGSQFEDYVNEFLAEFQAAPADIKEQLINKWSRLAATNHKKCPVTLAEVSESEGTKPEIMESELEAGGSRPVTRENLTEIVKLKKAMAINNMAVWKKLIEPYQVETAKDMTDGQAVDFIERLRAMQDDPSLLPF